MNNAEYWAKRFLNLEALQNKEAARVLADIEHQFAEAQRSIDDQIHVWYSRFADNNQVSFADAQKWLTGKDLAEFKWDVNQYIKYGQENALNQQWIKQLENASAKFHVSRLEALKIQTQNTMERLYGNQLDAIDSLMKRAYLDSYYHSIYEVQRGTGIGWDIAGINEKQLEGVLSRPWTTDGNTFSDRIWTQKDRLIDEVHTQLAQNMILGRSPDESIKAIAAKVNTSRANAGRLVMTEQAYFTSLAEKNAYKELGVDTYQIHATLDNRTSPICQDMDGQVFPTSKFQAGVTAPPFHPWCRTTTVPYFDDDAGERIARGEDGETYHVPQDMNYKEWKEKFVDNSEKEEYNQSGGSSGALRPDSEEAQRHADLYYEEIRKRKSDVSAIAKNTSFSEQEVRQIKDHVFINKHKFIDGRVERFFPSYHQAQSWQRMQLGTHTAEDIIFMNHELVESKLMDNGLFYELAHEKANEQFNWEILILKK